MTTVTRGRPDPSAGGDGLAFLVRLGGLGDRNWWFPKWLDRILPKIDVDGAHHEAIINLATAEAAEPDEEREPVTTG